MARKSRGRGAVAALGFFLLFAGLVGGAVLYIVSQQRPGQAVDGFARAPVGCTTTLEFSEIGDFYVFEEVGAAETVEGCQPVATPDAEFSTTFDGDLTPSRVVADASVSYDVDGFDGRSVQRITIDEPGEYTVAVVGEDLTVVAAIGRDPDDDVATLRRNALVVALVGIVAGLLLLVVSGRRSKRAGVVGVPDGPGSAPAGQSADGPWEREHVRPDQVPVNPHEPTARATAEVPTASLPGLELPGAPEWAPPSVDAAPVVPASAPELPEPTGEDELDDTDSNDTDDEGDEGDDSDEDNDSDGDAPVLPDVPGRPSGT